MGKADIRRSLYASQQYAPPDMTLTLDAVEVDGQLVRSLWTCMAPTLPRPMRGQDVWTIRDGKIVRLETSFLP